MSSLHPSPETLRWWRAIVGEDLGKRSWPISPGHPGTMDVVCCDGTVPVIVTGSRAWPHPEVVGDALMDAWHDAQQVYGLGITVVHGACPTGADSHAAAWARENNVPVREYPADWLAEGKAAGPLRNQRMVDAGAELCLAFLTETSVGTADCVNRALEADIPVRRFTA